MLQRELVLEFMGCSAQDSGLENRLQPTQASFIAEIPNTGRICADWSNAAAPSECTNTAPPKLGQGQALRAPAAALTQLRTTRSGPSYEGEAANHAPPVV